MDNIKKLKRTAKLITILTKYGFETLVTQTGIKKLIPNNFIEKNEKRKEIFSLTIYERIRLVLEELGPAYIKLGQLLSNRSDILPEELTNELQKLQDNVSYNDIDIHEVLREELRIDPNEVFKQIDLEPIAAASLSQVYTATLIDGNKKVVIKVKRKGILEIIEADLLIMKDFSATLEKYYDSAKQIGLSYIINTFEKSIMSELSFVQELDNIERFRANFKDDPHIYVPITYRHISNANILCMEFIDGIKISDKQNILAYGLDIKEVASRVVDLYLKQIIEHGFFHADPHSGNIFVLRDGRIVFIDYGSVGRMLPQDMDYVADFIIYALRKDMKRLVRVIKKISIKYSISNELQLERDLYFFIDVLSSSSIKDLDVNDVAKKFSRLLNENRTILPDYVYLLIRGIVLLEGIGLELGIETDIIENVKPYGLKLINKKFSPQYIKNKVINKLYDLGDRIEELPEDTHALIQKMNNNEMQILYKIDGIRSIKNTIDRVVIAIITASMAIGSAILIHAKMPPLLWDVSVLGFLGFIFADIIAIVLIINIIRDRE